MPERLAKLPRLISLVPYRFEDGEFSGVPRFDFELRRALPKLQSVSIKFWTRAWLRWLAWREPDTIVITGNETSMLVPQGLRTIVMHHGCAQTHWDRDPEWRWSLPRTMCQGQRNMYGLANRWYVAIARWTAEQFSQQYGVPQARVLPSWVESIARQPRAVGRKVVLGDFRSFNKGSRTVDQLRERVPELEFRALKCTYQTRMAAYAEVDAYLCLSLSEGGAFSVSDAEAASLPLVTTDVGNYLEYASSYVLSWQERDDVELVARKLEQALASERGPSFFESWTFEQWQNGWRQLVEEVADTRERAPLRSQLGALPSPTAPSAGSSR
ncbi:MAG TPA: hypothetical protein VIW29_08245 [Polyangiaceae bacterium]